MTRAEFVQRLILDFISDDFENVDQTLLGDVAAVAAKCGLTVERSEVVAGLRSLVEAGFAKAYDLSINAPDPGFGELAEMPSLDSAGPPFGIYFHVTGKGKEFHQSDATWWPLDDDETLRPGWEPPIA